jgi:hypothetical protein
MLPELWVLNTAGDVSVAVKKGPFWQDKRDQYCGYAMVSGSRIRFLVGDLSFRHCWWLFNFGRFGDMSLSFSLTSVYKLPLYLEERPCAAPTTERLFELFADLRRHRLLDDTGHVHQRFYDKLNDPQLTVLRLFSISPQQYLSTAEESAAE